MGVLRKEIKCNEFNCIKPAAFNFEEEMFPTHCFQHKIEGMVNVKFRNCHEKHCRKVASYNFRAEIIPIFCIHHKHEGMVNVNTHRSYCENMSCESPPVYNFPGEKKRRFCETHKFEGMVCVNSKVANKLLRQCQHHGCSNTALLNDEGENRGKFCVDHQQQGMISAHSQSQGCYHQECPYWPCFNCLGENNAVACPDHRQEGMVPVCFREHCSHQGCLNRAFYQYRHSQENNNKFCKLHKMDGMETVCVELCDNPTCSFQYSFLNSDPREASFVATCCKHRSATMILSSKRCNFPGCFKKFPHFKCQNNDMRRFCDEHRTENTVLVNADKNYFCVVEGCGKKALYKLIGSSWTDVVASFCSDHKVAGTVPVTKNQMCKISGCKKTPRFNFDGLSRSYCEEHKVEGMINLSKQPRCKFTDCRKASTFNFPSESRSRFCFDHKMKGMVEVKTQYRAMCTVAKCNNGAWYNVPSEPKPAFCVEHKTDRMVHKRNLVPCEREGCVLAASFKYKNDTKAKFCGIHKLETMISVRVKLCQQPGCEQRAICRSQDDPKHTFCGSHMLAGMAKFQGVCQYLSCDGSAQYNYAGETKGMFCGLHRLEGMIPIRSLGGSCDVKGCTKLRSFNFSGLKPRFCSAHKTKGMVEPNNSVQKQSLCLRDGCNKVASCNFLSEKGSLYCGEHKLAGMVYKSAVVQECEQDGCAVLPTSNFEGEKQPQFCLNRKTDSMSNCTNKLCENLGCTKEAVCKFLDDSHFCRCGNHIVDGMIKQKNVCEFQRCDNSADFNFPEECSGRFCGLHKFDGMIVRENQCESFGCPRIREYNFVGLEPRFCAQHKAYSMVNLMKLCQGTDCKRKATFNHPGKTEGVYCEEHHLEGMVNASKQHGYHFFSVSPTSPCRASPEESERFKESTRSPLHQMHKSPASSLHRFREHDTDFSISPNRENNYQPLNPVYRDLIGSLLPPPSTQQDLPYTMPISYYSGMASNSSIPECSFATSQNSNKQNIFAVPNYCESPGNW